MRRSTLVAPMRSASSSAASTALHSATLLVRTPRKVASSAKVSPVSASRRMAPSPAGPGWPRAAPSGWIRRRRCGRLEEGAAGSGTPGLLDLLGHFEDGARDVDSARASFDTVEDGPAPPYAVGVGHELEALFVRRVAAVEDEPMGVDDRRRTHVVGVGPEDRARCGAGRAQDAARGVLVQLAVSWRLAPLLAVLGDLIIDQVRHGGAVLRKEVLHVDQEVLDDRHAAQRLNGDALAGVLDEVLAREPIAPVDEHRIRSAHAVGARASEGQRS